MTVDFGFDLNTPDVADLDPYFTAISEGELIGQALARRLVTPRGALALIGDDPRYGYDVRVHLNDEDPNVGAIEAAVVEQLVLDERVQRATATVTFDSEAGTLQIVATAYTAAGPFRLTLDVSAVTVTLLTTEAL